MSRYVVYESHQFEDDKCEMPDMDDFESLSEKIKAIRKLCGTAVAKKVFETRMAEVERHVAATAQQTEDRLSAFSDAMTNGDWREGFKRDVGQALEQLERRYAALNDELNKKIEELSKVSEIEAVLSKMMVDFQENVVRILDGKPVRQLTGRPVKQTSFLSRMVSQGFSRLRGFSRTSSTQSHSADQ